MSDVHSASLERVLLTDRVEEDVRASGEASRKRRDQDANRAFLSSVRKEHARQEAEARVARDQREAEEATRKRRDRDANQALVRLLREGRVGR